ncbi:MAG: hypothetical protein AAGJ86_01355 [Pseudomonadota bacterium]
MIVVMFLPTVAAAEIFTVDFVKVLNGNEAEAVFYYEENWKRLRAAALEAGHISSYQMLVKRSDEGRVDLLLVTGYASEAEFANREANFRSVMNTLGFDGPRLKNTIPPDQFRALVDEAVYQEE